MIVLNVTYHCRPGMRERFLEQIREEGIDAACLAEAGNIKYHYYLPVADSDELLLVEKWEDAASLAAHMQQAHFRRLGEIKEAYIEDTSIEKFEA